MKIRIQRVDKSLELPVYETNGSVGFDLSARESVLVAPQSIALVPANIIVEIPETHMLLIASRSSTPRKMGLSFPHGIGIIDHDYHGPDDEIHIQVYNFSSKEVRVERGQKIAQGIFVPIDKFEWEEMHENKNPNRGGFGSTDPLQ